MAQHSVLIVAKFRDVRAVLRDVFSIADYRCLVARDAGEALELFRQSRPALVVSDLKMPAMSVSGVELLRRVRREDPDVAVILLTGDSGAKAVADCRKLGAFKVLAKPVHIDELLITAERALERRQLLIERRQSRAAMGLPARS